MLISCEDGSSHSPSLPCSVPASGADAAECAVPGQHVRDLQCVRRKSTHYVLVFNRWKWGKTNHLFVNSLEWCVFFLWGFKIVIDYTHGSWSVLEGQSCGYHVTQQSWDRARPQVAAVLVLGHLGWRCGQCSTRGPQELCSKSLSAKLDHWTPWTMGSYGII